MTGITNRTRAARAEAALRCYVEAKGEVFENSADEIADLIADLLHLAASIDEDGGSVERALRLGRLHFEAEHGNPEETGEDGGQP
jgi:NTP pyrophosphatase (non-canonical NTP hydrolase)